MHTGTYRHSPEIRAKIAEGIHRARMAKTWNNNGAKKSKSLSVALKGKLKSLAHREHLSVAGLGKHRTLESRQRQSLSAAGQPKSLVHRERIRLAHVGKHGDLPVLARPVLSALWRENREWTAATIRKIRGRQTKPTSLERRLNSIITKFALPFVFTGNGTVIVAGLNPDFVGIGSRRVIEIYGDYWHLNAVSLARDFRRRIRYEEVGYKVLVLREAEMSIQSDHAIAKVIITWAKEERLL